MWLLFKLDISRIHINFPSALHTCCKPVNCPSQHVLYICVWCTIPTICSWIISWKLEGFFLVFPLTWKELIIYFKVINLKPHTHRFGTHVHARTHTHTHTHTYKHTYIYIHTYIHTYVFHNNRNNYYNFSVGAMS